MILTIDQNKYTLPSSWTDLSFKQWSYIQATDGTLLKVLSVITGIAEDLLLLIGYEQIQEKLMPFLGWISQPFNVAGLPMPATFDWRQLPDITGLTFGQKLLAHQVMIDNEKKGKPLNSCMPMVIATFMASVYNPNKVELIEDYAKKIEQKKICEVFPVGSFFLTRCLK